MYKVLKFDDETVYLINSDGDLKKLDRQLFDFTIELGTKVDLFKDGQSFIVVLYHEDKVLELDGEKSVKSDLLQGILDLFLETLSIHNNHLGNLKKIFSQLLITIFMAWSLFGVIIIEILLFIESLLVFIWKLILRLFGSLHLAENSKKIWANEKEKFKAIRDEEREKKEKNNENQPEGSTQKSLEKKEVFDEPVDTNNDNWFSQLG